MPAFRRFGNTQFRYAVAYVFITLAALVFLNLYCSRVSQQMFYHSKESSLIEKCLLASDEISNLDVINSDGISKSLEELDSLTSTRIIVTDTTGWVVYDSLNLDVGHYALLPEIVEALDTSAHPYGNKAFTWLLQDTGIRASAATPIVSYGSVVGCVYMMDFDVEQGRLLRSLQINILHITLLLEAIVVVFSLIFYRAYSRRLQRIMKSMRVIQEGDYSHKVPLEGSDELTVLGEEINELTDRLQDAEEQRRRFVSDASHELKTPLASIKLLTDSILQNYMDMDTIREFVGDIGDEAERLNRVAAKLLSLTRIDSNPQFDAQIIPIAPTVRRAERRLKAIADAEKISVRLECIQDAPILIAEDDLYQIVYNLMENGIKYNLPGGTLTVRISRDADNAYLEVRDTGMGIPEDAIPHLFERFYRVDKARSRQTGGSGLGLAIVWAIVERSRGDIQVSSTLGKGTVFTVTFPAFDTEVDTE